MRGLLDQHSVTAHKYGPLSDVSGYSSAPADVYVPGSPKPPGSSLLKKILMYPDASCQTMIDNMQDLSCLLIGNQGSDYVLKHSDILELPGLR